MREHVIQTERQHERRVKVCKEPFVINTSYDAIKNKPQINSVVEKIINHLKSMVFMH